jgi:glucose/mannose-6-phosphate isomerase
MAPRPLTGPERMRELALQLPHQLRDGFRAGREADASVPADARQIVVVGMGGSAIAGDLASVLTEPETEAALATVRSPDLPRWVDRKALAILASYSGNTWETLAAYDEAGRRGVPRLVLTSGGKLAERAAADEVPCLVVPAGGPPRAWVGHMFGGLLGLLDPIFPESNEERMEESLAALEHGLPRLSSRSGAPVRWAETIGDRQPAVYADTGFSGLARRWKTQIEENAKRGASFDIVPELFHNAIVGWDATRGVDVRRRAVVQLEWSGAPATTRQRFDYLARMLGQRGVPRVRVPLEAPDRLTALLLGLSMGDFVSLALADSARVDPYPVDAITRMKEALEPAAKRARTSRRRTR